MADEVLERMTTQDLLTAAERSGIELRADGDQLIVRGPRAAQEFGHVLLKRKAEVLKLLASPEWKLEGALQQHDWYYHFSDDAEVRRRGEESTSRLLPLVCRCKPAAASALWRKYHPGANTPASPGAWPPAGLSPCPTQDEPRRQLVDTEVTAPGSGPSWDASRAATVIANVDAIIAQEVAEGGRANTAARQLLLTNDGLIVRRLQRAQDEMLWQWPDALVRLMARWRDVDSAGRSGPAADAGQRTQRFRREEV
jgi:hypothetical protein